MNDRNEKYAEYVKQDEMNNCGRLLNACDELSFLLQNPKVNNIFAKHFLNEILTYATTFSDFYKKYRGFKSLQDFPIMRKQDLKDHWDEIRIKEYEDDIELVTKYTSGSTGTPFRMIMDKYKHARWIAGNKVLRDMDGVKSHEKTFFINANVSDKKIPMERQERDNVYYVDLEYRDDVSFEKLLYRMMNEHVRTMTAIASIYDALAHYISEGKAPEWRGDFLAVFSMSEHLKETTREIISNYFHCPMFDYFANEENGAFAMEDGTGNGRLVNTVDYYFEVLALDKDEPVAEGEVGRLVITDYFNKAFPMIRYENGDLVAIKHMKDGKAYITKIQGRITDALYATNGTMVDFFHAISFLEPCQDIKQFQLVQNDIKEFKWILNTTNRSYEQMIIEECKKLFGNDSNWRFEYVDEIPRLRSGKYRMTVCNIPQGHLKKEL